MAQLSANSASTAGTPYSPDWSPQVNVGGTTIPSPSGYVISGGGTYSPYAGPGMGIYGPTDTYTPQTSGNNGSVLGLGTNAPTGGSPGGGNNGGTGGSGGGSSSSGSNSNQSQFNAQQQAIIDAYNNMISNMEAQKGPLASAYNQNLGILNTQDQANQQALQQNQQYLGTQNQLAQGQLGQSYQDQLALNREMARSMGSFGSDYAQIQNRAGNTYGQNQLGAYNTYQGGLNSLMQQFNQANVQLQQAKVNLGQQYQQALTNIALAEGQSDAQKIGAIQNLQNNYNYMQTLIDSYQRYNMPSNYNAVGALGTLGQTAGNNLMAYPQAFNQQNMITNPVMNGVAGGPDQTKKLGGLFGTGVLQGQFGLPANQFSS